MGNRGTGNAQAYDVLLRGWQHYLRQTPEEFRAAIADFRKATEIDPGYGRAWAALAAVYWETYTRYWAAAVGIDRHSHFEAQEFLDKAKGDPTSLAHQVRSAMLLHAGRHADAVAEAQKGIASDPNDADGYVGLAGALSFAGRPAEALEAVERAMRLNPHFPSSYAYQRGLALFGSGASRRRRRRSSARSRSTPTTTGRSGCCSRSTARRASAPRRPSFSRPWVPSPAAAGRATIR